MGEGWGQAGAARLGKRWRWSQRSSAWVGVGPEGRATRVWPVTALGAG